MRLYSVLKIAFLGASSIFVLAACSGSSSSGGGAKGDEIVVTHLERFDFSEAAYVGTGDDDRADFIPAASWEEDPETPFVLIRSGISHSNISDLGEGDFSLFEELPEQFDTEMDDADVFVSAVVGHVYLFEMDDGYAIAKITKIEDVGGDDEVEITMNYQFSEEGDF